MIDVLMDSQSWTNFIIAIFFTVCYSYQFFYIFIALIRKPRVFKKDIPHRIAILISARDEEAVIGHLIDSINKQTYNKEYLSVFVVADNCTDNTAQIAADRGATVFKRTNDKLIGKGYALDFLVGKIYKRYTEDFFDGYIILDADNLLDKNYVSEMNKAFSDGNRIVTSYRNSKNYGANWITAGYALWFLREAKFLNNARMILHTSSAVSGTGFMFHKDVIKRKGGWKYFLLTEDIEFTIDSIVHDEKIAYAHEAVLYDEQPDTFKQSWRQRLRWAKGYLQVFRKHGFDLLKGIFESKNKFACFDMCMTIMPAIMLTILSFVVNTVAFIPVAIQRDGVLLQYLASIMQTLFNSYLLLFVIGGFAVITEWKKILCSAPKKILYLFTFPLFMLTYIPISVVALFKKIEWKPIKHTVSIPIEDMNKEKAD